MNFRAEDSDLLFFEPFVYNLTKNELMGLRQKIGDQEGEGGAVQEIEEIVHKLRGVSRWNFAQQIAEK